MIRAHKIRINPTPEQAKYLRKACGTSRFAFNWGLGRWKEAKSQGVAEYGPMALKKEFNAIKREAYPWALDVTKNAVEDGFRRLGVALNNYYASKNGKRRGERMGFPNFRSKKHKRQSFTLDYEHFKVDGHNLTIAKLASPINMAEVLRYNGKLVWATVSSVAGHWYVSIQVELPDPEPAPDLGRAVGVDVGVKTLATLSTGAQFENQKLLRSELSHYKRLSRRLSRRHEGSGRWYVAQRKLARFHERIANRRQDVIHKLTTQIARDYDTVAVENLHVKGMMRNHKLALSLADASMSEILRQLGYKAGRVIRVGRFYASSKTCHACGFVHRALTLSDRTWACEGCGTVHERDWNAAENILSEGLRLAAL